MVHVPALTKVSVVPETVHTPVVDEARDTVNPESDDAVRVAVPDESCCSPGSLNVMVCAWSLPPPPPPLDAVTEKERDTSVAAK